MGKHDNHLWNRRSAETESAHMTLSNGSEKRELSQRKYPVLIRQAVGCQKAGRPLRLWDDYDGVLQR